MSKKLIENNVLYDLIQYQNKNAHSHNLKNIKGLVDNKEPKTFSHKVSGGKKNYFKSMKNKEQLNENLALMQKIDKISSRQNIKELSSSTKSAAKLKSNHSTNHSTTYEIVPKDKSPLRLVNIHNYSDYEVHQINLNNKIMAQKLNKVSSTIKNFKKSGDSIMNNNSHEYYKHQISKFNRKNKLLKTMTSITKLYKEQFKDRLIEDEIDYMQYLALKEAHENEQAQMYMTHQTMATLDVIKEEQFRPKSPLSAIQLNKHKEQYKNICSKNKLLSKYMNETLKWTNDTTYDKFKEDYYKKNKGSKSSNYYQNKSTHFDKDYKVLANKRYDSLDVKKFNNRSLDTLKLKNNNSGIDRYKEIDHENDILSNHENSKTKIIEDTPIYGSNEFNNIEDKNRLKNTEESRKNTEIINKPNDLNYTDLEIEEKDCQNSNDKLNGQSENYDLEGIDEFNEIEVKNETGIYESDDFIQESPFKNDFNNMNNTVGESIKSIDEISMARDIINDI